MNNEIEYKQVSVRLKPELYSRLEKLAKTVCRQIKLNFFS